MAAPKHLWAGDWERESAHAASQRIEPPPTQPEAAAAPAPEPRGERRRRFGIRQLAATLAVLVVAAVAVVIVTSSGGSAPSPAKAAVNGPSATWLGMQVVDSPSGAAVSTVPYGSAGDAIGFEPGDVITQIGSDPVDSPKQIQAAVAKVPLGRQIQITISRGSSILTATVTLRQRPTIQP